MKFLIPGWLLLFCVWDVFSQGTFLYDQQSADETSTAERAPTAIQLAEPMGQSFTPSLSAVGFVRLIMSDEHGGNGQGATVSLNILSGGISGTVIGASGAVTMPDNFGLGTGNTGYVDFFFATPVSVTPGTVYYIEPVVQSGDLWGVSGGISYNYAGGAQYYQGNAQSGADLWFREGIVVPEPSTWTLLALGGGAVFLRRKLC